MPAPKSYEVLAEIESEKSGDIYEIRRGGDGVIYCYNQDNGHACKGWVFSKEHPKSCKHIRAWQMAPKGATNAPVNMTSKAKAAKPDISFVPPTSNLAEQLKKSLADKSGVSLAQASAASATEPLYVRLSALALRVETGGIVACGPKELCALLREASSALAGGKAAAAVVVPTYQPVLGAVRRIIID